MNCKHAIAEWSILGGVVTFQCKACDARMVCPGGAWEHNREARLEHALVRVKELEARLVHHCRMCGGLLACADCGEPRYSGATRLERLEGLQPADNCACGTCSILGGRRA